MRSKMFQEDLGRACSRQLRSIVQSMELDRRRRSLSTTVLCTRDQLRHLHSLHIAPWSEDALAPSMARLWRSIVPNGHIVPPTIRSQRMSFHLGKSTHSISTSITHTILRMSILAHHGQNRGSRLKCLSYTHRPAIQYLV